MSKDKRFEVASKQGMIESYSVIVDQETGVNYLYFASGYGGGLTVLLDSEGKPIVTR